MAPESDYPEYEWARWFAEIGAFFAVLDAVCWVLAFTVAPGAINPAVGILPWAIGLLVTSAVVTVRGKDAA